MTVQITPKSTQHTGLAPSIEGSVAAWQVTPRALTATSCCPHSHDWLRLGQDRPAAIRARTDCCEPSHNARATRRR